MVGSALLVPDAKAPDPSDDADDADLIPPLGSRREMREQRRKARSETRKAKRDLQARGMIKRGLHAYGLRKQYPRYLRNTGTYLTHVEGFDFRRDNPDWLNRLKKAFQGRADCAPNFRGTVTSFISQGFGHSDCKSGRGSEFKMGTARLTSIILMRDHLIFGGPGVASPKTATQTSNGLG